MLYIIDHFVISIVPYILESTSGQNLLHFVIEFIIVIIFITPLFRGVHGPQSGDIHSFVPTGPWETFADWVMHHPKHPQIRGFETPNYLSSAG